MQCSYLTKYVEFLCKITTDVVDEPFDYQQYKKKFPLLIKHYNIA